jgi:hypothetical protein
MRTAVAEWRLHDAQRDLDAPLDVFLFCHAGQVVYAGVLLTGRTPQLLRTPADGRGLLMTPTCPA